MIDFKYDSVGVFDDPKTLFEFKNAYPKLFETNASIEATLIHHEFRGDDTWNGFVIYNPPKSRIDITHKFLFDNRLIPKKFNEAEIRNCLIGGYPKPFPLFTRNSNERAAFHPKHYINYVKMNMAHIRMTFKDEKLTELQALDALVTQADFSSYIDYWLTLCPTPERFL